MKTTIHSSGYQERRPSKCNWTFSRMKLIFKSKIYMNKSSGSTRVLKVSCFKQRKDAFFECDYIRCKSPLDSAEADVSFLLGYKYSVETEYSSLSLR